MDFKSFIDFAGIDFPHMTKGETNLEDAEIIMLNLARRLFNGSGLVSPLELVVILGMVNFKLPCKPLNYSKIRY